MVSPELREWSSAAAHVGDGNAAEVLDMRAWGEIMEPEAWRKMLARVPAKAEVMRLRKSTQRGWPMAGDSFLAKVEKHLNRRLRPLSVGRPVGAKDQRKRKRRSSRALLVR